MSLLSSILKDEHAGLLKLLGELQRIDLRSPEGGELLLLTKVMLFDHLKKEDKYLYPELRKYEQGGLLANSYACEMTALTNIAREFFKKYDCGGAGMSFSKDLGEFIGALKERIIKEDCVLLPKFDEITGQ